MSEKQQLQKLLADGSLARTSLSTSSTPSSSPQTTSDTHSVSPGRLTSYTTPPPSPKSIHQRLHPSVVSPSARISTSADSKRPPKKKPQPLSLQLEPSSWEDGDVNRTAIARDYPSSDQHPRTAVPSRNAGPIGRSPQANTTSRLNPLTNPLSPSQSSTDMPGTTPLDQRARSPLSSGFFSPSSTPLPSIRRTGPVPPPLASTSSLGSGPSSHVLSAPPSVRAPTYSHTLASPCFVHSHLDHSLSDFVEKEAAGSVSKKKKPVPLKGGVEDGMLPEGTSRTTSATVSEDEEEEDQPSLTRQLAATAVSVREMSKQLGRTRVVSHIQSVMIITKARDNHLISLTRELALWLMQTPRNGRDRGLVVYVDTQLRTSKRFDADGLERDHPELFKPLPRRYSRTSSSVSLASSLDGGIKKMTPLSSLNDTLKRQTSGEYVKKSEGDEGQLRYWTNEMCTTSPHLFDFVVTLGGDGTVLYASWLFQCVVPPVIPFALGSLGFLTNFDFSSYAHTLNNAIDNGIRVNLRMRFTCTVYRAVESRGSKKRRAMRTGSGDIFMNSLTKDGWEAIESGGMNRANQQGQQRRSGKDKEIKCFTTFPSESFEVLNELVVDRGPSPYVSLLELFGDNDHLTSAQADGITVSTPTGSTAYSLSAGGSLVHPEIPALLITPICPHTLSFRPMLLPDSMELRICVPYNSRSTAWASFDGRGRVELKQGDHIKVTASQYPFPTVCADKQSTDWFNSISRTLRWNERERQKSFVILEEGRKKPRNTTLDQRNAENANAADGGAALAAAAAKVSFEEEDTEDDEDYSDDEDEEEAQEEEAFDIDDLSSEAHTNANNSPSMLAHDPTVSNIPPLLTKALSSPSSVSLKQPIRPPHVRESSETSSIDLPDNPADRFHQAVPKPPRLSSRHSYNDTSQVFDRTPVSAPPDFTSHRMPGSMRGGESGSAKKLAAGLRRPKSQEGGARLATPAVRSFAVVGADIDSDTADEGSDRE